jgi:two-component system capsular synthesis response regulator RcsB
MCLGVDQLTPEEFEVFIKLASGLTVKDIAQERNRSVKTVECQKYTLMVKLAIHSQVHLAHYALYLGLIEYHLPPQAAYYGA